MIPTELLSRLEAIRANAIERAGREGADANEECLLAVYRRALSDCLNICDAEITRHTEAADRYHLERKTFFGNNSDAYAIGAKMCRDAIRRAIDRSGR